MAKTNLTYVKKVFGVNEKTGYVKCALDYEINLDKIPNIEFISALPEFKELINELHYCGGVPMYAEDCNGNESTYGVLVFSTFGESQCAPGDTFDVELGKKLALTRAQRDAFKTAECFYMEIINIVEEKFDGLYRLHYGCTNSAENCKYHEYDLTDYDPTNGVIDFLNSDK